MWITQKIKKDKKTHQTLQAFSKQIKEQSDPTIIDSEKKFSIAADLGKLSRPNKTSYFVLFFASMAVFYFCNDYKSVTMSEFEKWNDICLTISSSILVLGITLTSLSKDISESSRFAGEYLTECCKVQLFACVTLITVLCGFGSKIILPQTDMSKWSEVIYLVVSALSLSGAIWCLVCLTYVIVETAKCMNPNYSIKVASNYASRKLGHAFLKEAYLSVYMSKYDEILRDHLEPLTNIHEPKEYWAGGFNDKEYYTLYLQKEIDFSFGFKDYNLSQLAKINNELKSKNAELYLATHGLDTVDFGMIYYEKPCYEVAALIDKKLPTICKFRNDKHRQSNKDFWRQIHSALSSVLSKSIRNSNLLQFKGHLKTLENFCDIIRQVREYRLVRQNMKLDYNQTQLLQNYSKSLVLVLKSAEMEEDIQVSFLMALEESISRQAVQDFKKGDWYVLDLLIWQVSVIYKTFCTLVMDKSSSLWESRARFGMFYSCSDNIVASGKRGISEEDVLKVKKILYRGVMNWVCLAKENDDIELIESLCDKARDLVFQDEQIKFFPRDLLELHFVLCGKILGWLKEENSCISAKAFKLLCVREYGHIRHGAIDFKKLVRFFDEARKSNLRDELRGFYEADYKLDPLTGCGGGEVKSQFSSIGVDQMFIYYALQSITSDTEAMPFDNNLEGTIAFFEDIASALELYAFATQRKLLEKWLADSRELYRAKEERRIAETKVGPEASLYYNRGFEEGYKHSIPFVDYCVEKGYIEASEEVCRNIKQRVWKEALLRSRNEGIQSVGQRDGKKFGSIDNKGLLNSLVDDEDKVMDKYRNFSAELIRNETVSQKAKKQVQRAVEWLRGSGCSTDQGIIILKELRPDILGIFGDDEYKSIWNGEGFEKGIEGYYHGYPVVHISERKKYPLCAAIDFRGWSGIEVHPRLVENGQAGRVLEIRERNRFELKNATGRNADKLFWARGICVVELEMLWRCSDTKPNQKIFTYELRC